MIKRLYADNFLCLSNFEFKPNRLNLLLGDNGSGKSAVFHVLSGLAGLVLGKYKLPEVFPLDSATRWEKRSRQRFEMEFEDSAGLFRYTLVVEHGEGRKSPVVASERVDLDGDSLYEFIEGEVQLFNDQFEARASFPFNPEIPFLPLIEPRKENRKLIAFKEDLEGIWHLALDPRSMLAESKEESDSIQVDGANFVDWYRTVVQERQQVLSNLFADLEERMDGFKHLNLNPSKVSRDVRELLVVATADGGATDYELRFDELSTGQQALIFYYTLLHAAVEEGRVLLLDEPDNYVSIQEIQPWLIRLSDKIDEGYGQVFIISHNSEVINYLNDPAPWFFERKDGGPARATPLEICSDSGLSTSELMARGWVDGE